MANPTQPSIQLTNTSDYRENYANSVQVRVNVWDFFLVFGTLQQQDETKVEVNNFQGIYLSPQQAKALYTILQQNLVNYEGTFGEIKLDPRMNPRRRTDPLNPWAASFRSREHQGRLALPCPRDVTAWESARDQLFAFSLIFTSLFLSACARCCACRTSGTKRDTSFPRRATCC